MPLLPTKPVDIVLEIPDVVIDATTLKRKAKLFALIYNMNTKQVSISWTVCHYAADDDGSYGADLSSFIPSYSKEQIATNEVPVNPVTGFPLDPEDIKPTIVTDPITGEVLEVIPSLTPWVGQYDFFNNMGENVPVKVNDVIRQFGQGLQDWSKQ
jgi:hypothetical protein